MNDQSGILLGGQLYAFKDAAKALPAQVRQALMRCLLDELPVRQMEPTALLSADDEPWKPSMRLYEIGAQLAATVPLITHPLLAARTGGGARWFEVFPGEHYHLLTALCRLLRPRVVWEFGTDLGMSALAMLEGLDPEARVFTVDIEPWQTKSGAWLQQEDIASGRVTQVVADMKAPELFAAHGAFLAQADLIFVDGPKDGFTEDAFFAALGQIPFTSRPIILVDDIRLSPMLRLSRAIARPKFDITSYGHWSGTMLIDWVPA